MNESSLRASGRRKKAFRTSVSVMFIMVIIFVVIIIVPSKISYSIRSEFWSYSIRNYSFFRNFYSKKDMIDKLACLGSSSVPTLTRNLKHPSAEVRYLSMKALDRLGKRASSALSDVKKSLFDSNDDIRSLAVRIIGRIQKSKDLLTVVKRGIYDKALSVRYEAIMLLLKLDPKVQEHMVPNLLTTLKKYPTVVERAPVIFAMQKIKINNVHKVQNILTKWLYHKRPDIRSSAVEALGSIGNSTPQLISLLLRKLKNSSVLEKCSIAKAFSKLAPKKEEVAKALAHQINVKTDRLDLVCIINNLKIFNKTAIESIVPIINSAILMKNIRVRKELIELLDLSQVNVNLAVPSLKFVFMGDHSFDKRSRNLAAKCLAKLIPHTLYIFERAVGKKVPGVQDAAIYGLRTIEQKKQRKQAEKIMKKLLKAVPRKKSRQRGKPMGCQARRDDE